VTFRLIELDDHVRYFELLDPDVLYLHHDLFHCYYSIVFDDYDQNVAMFFDDDFVILIDYLNYVMKWMNEKIGNSMNDVVNMNAMNCDVHDYHLN
jgi:hypothetical protein